MQIGILFDSNLCCFAMMELVFIQLVSGLVVELQLLYENTVQAWKKCLFPCKLGKISLQCGMVSLMYFFIFSLEISKFPSKELPVLPFFSMPDSVNTIPAYQEIFQTEYPLPHPLRPTPSSENFIDKS